LQNIQKGSQEKIYLNVYVSGVLTQADSIPTLTIVDADTGVSLLSSSTAIDDKPTGVYSWVLNQNITNTNRVIQVTWTYHTNGITATSDQFYSIETSYASTSEIVDFLGYGSDPSELNYYDPKDVYKAEKLARTIVEGYTDIKFYTYYGSQEVFGKGSDALELVERVLSIDKVWENDLLLIDNTQNPAYNTFGFGLQITPTGRAIRIVNAGWDVRYDNQVDPAVLYYGRFRDNARYKIQGQIGYKYVPEDIKLATMLLVGDILANDYNWRNKYLSKVNLSEISFEMAKGAFNGTGNVMVDNILDLYRNLNIVII
jgi:hypothetical protein